MFLFSLFFVDHLLWFSTPYESFHCYSVVQGRKLQFRKIEKSGQSCPGVRDDEARWSDSGPCMWATTQHLHQVTDRPEQPHKFTCCHSSQLPANTSSWSPPLPTWPSQGGPQCTSCSVDPCECTRKSASAGCWQASEKQTAELQEIQGLEYIEFQYNKKKLSFGCLGRIWREGAGRLACKKAQVLILHSGTPTDTI